MSTACLPSSHKAVQFNESDESFGIYQGIRGTPEVHRRWEANIGFLGKRGMEIHRVDNDVSIDGKQDCIQNNFAR